MSLAYQLDERAVDSSIPTHDVDRLRDWFLSIGHTDERYLRGHFARFVSTRAFAAETLAPGSIILDVGAHWLHQAAFFAADGHKMICSDVYLDIVHGLVKPVAEAIGAKLINLKSLDNLDAFAELPDNSVDALLFSEIIEHITFNPVNMWKGFYRVLKPGGRIYITTPNSMHFARICQKLNAVIDGCEYGVNVGEIFANGTFGHHWKEFSIPELRRYFAAISPDFVIDRVSARSINRIDLVEFRKTASIAGIYSLDQLVETLDKAGAQPFGEQIMMDIRLEKREGINISPPW